MGSIFENFKADLDKLQPLVRNKALKIAQRLMQEENLSEKEAIEKGIAQAEEWFLDAGG